MENPIKIDDLVVITIILEIPKYSCCLKGPLNKKEHGRPNQPCAPSSHHPFAPAQRDAAIASKNRKDEADFAASDCKVPEPAVLLSLMMCYIWLSQWLTFKLLGYLKGTIKFKLLFHGPLAE